MNYKDKKGLLQVGSITGTDTRLLGGSVDGNKDEATMY